MGAVWAAQSELLQLMAKTLKETNPFQIDQIKGKVDQVCERHLSRLTCTEKSEFWTAYISCVAFALGQSDFASKLISECTSFSKNPYWMVRFSYLLSRFGHFGDSDRILENIRREDQDVDYYVLAKKVELLFFNGNQSAALDLLRKLELSSGLDLKKMLTLSKTATRVKEFSIALKTCIKIADQYPEESAIHMLDIAKVVSASESDPNVCIFHLELLKLSSAENCDSASVLARGALLHMLGNHEDGSRLISGIIGSNFVDYHLLARTGKMLLDVGQILTADVYLEKSISLRPNAFLHYDYVGNIYFGAKQFDKASVYFEKALKFKPYLRHIHAKNLYSKLPENIKRMEIFGKNDDIQIIFQRKQDFYHDLGLANK